MTLLSRIFGYIRDLLQAAILGAADAADAYVIAFRIPNLLRRLLGEGALTAAFVPIFTDLRQKQGDDAARRFASTAFWTLGGVLLVVVGAGVLAAPGLVRFLAWGFTDIQGKLGLTTDLTRLMFPYLLFIGLAALVMAVLNSVGSFAPSAFTPVLLNLSIILFAVFLARDSEHPAFWFAVGVLVGGSLQLLFQLPFLIRHFPLAAPRFSFSDPSIRRMGKLMLPALFGVGVTQLNLVVDSQVASFLGTGSVSFLYYAIRVEELVLGVFVISLSTVILPALSRHASRGETVELHRTLATGLRFVAAITLPALAGLWVLSEPIINTLFQRGQFTSSDTSSTAWALAFYSLGLLPNGVVKILAPAFYARFDTATPVKVGAGAFLLHVPLCIVLARSMGHAGIALSTSLAAILNAGLLLVLLHRREAGDWLGAVGNTLLRSSMAALIMGGVIWAMLNWLGFDPGAGIGQRALLLSGLIGGGALLYLGMLLLLRAPEPAEIWRGLRGRLEISHPKSP